MPVRLAVSFLLAALLASGVCRAADEPVPPDAELAAEIEKERKTAERFLTLLERNPREGTSLDRAYGFFVEQGKLDDLVAGYRARVEADPKDGAAWMILGLIEARRGNDAPAVAAFEKAAEHRPQDPMAPYHLGRALAVAGRADKAIPAFEQAVARKPPRADLPAIFAELGRLHQRANHAGEAAKVWDRLEAAFPGDLRVRSEIAAILEEEGRPELALPRYEALAREAAGDEYRRVTYALKAAGLKSKLGKTDDAIADYERLLAGLNPDNWLYREVRRGLEAVYTRTDDVAGLAAYYEKWVAGHPEDVNAMARLAEILDDLGRAEESRDRFEKAVKLAPSDVRLRKAYVAALRDGGKHAEAAAQFAALDKAAPNDPDTLRDWGTTLLEDAATPEAERKAKAAAVWKRLVAARPKDPVVTAQVADWFRQAEMTDDALALYAKAVGQAPEDPRYLEYLGEYLHHLGRSDEAVATWTKLAADKNRTARSLVRLSEVLAGFGYRKDALDALADADALDLEFADRLRFAELLRDAERYDDAAGQLDKAAPLAESDEDRRNLLASRIETDQAAGRLDERIVELRAQAEKQPSAESLLTLALYLAETRDLPAAATAAQAAAAKDPRSVAAQATLARLAESSGQLAEAADALRRLAALDRRGRTEYLKQVAGLEQRLGRSEAALKTAREVLAAAPGAPDSYSFYADLCFRVGKPEDGLDSLRRAVRLAPGDSGPLLALAAALAEQFRTGEAVELYWQAFDKAEGFDDKAAVVARLAELYQRTGRFPELVKRLARPDAKDGREAKLLVAEAYQAGGDLSMASETLQALLAESPRDVPLLSRLSQLAERDRNFESAVKYQREVVELAPEDHREKNRLAQLYLGSDGVEAAEGFWDDLAAEGLDQVETLSLLDALIGAEKFAHALRLTDRRLRDRPDDWELLFRRGASLARTEADKKTSNEKAAGETFERILALDLPDETESAKAAAVKAKVQKSAVSGPTAAASMSALPAAMRRQSDATQAAAALGLVPMQSIYGSAAGRRPLWSPSDYGSARIAAIVWLGGSRPRSGGEAAAAADFSAKLKAAAEAPDASPRALWDWYYHASLSGVLPNRSATTPGLNDPAHLAAKRLAEAGGTDGAWVYLMRLRSSQNRRPNQPEPEPLPADEAELMLLAYERVRTAPGGPYSSYVATLVAEELNRSGRKDEARALVREMLARMNDPQSLSMAVSVAAASEDPETVNLLYDRLESLPPDMLAVASSGSSATRLMRVLWDEGKKDAVLKLLDRQLGLARKRLDAAKPPSTRRASSGVGSPGTELEFAL